MYSIEMKADAMLPRERLRDLGAEQLSNQESVSYTHLRAHET